MSAYKHLKNDGSGYLVKQYPSLPACNNTGMGTDWLCSDY